MWEDTRYFYLEEERTGQEKSDLCICLGVDERSAVPPCISAALSEVGSVRITFCSLLKEGKGRSELCGSSLSGGRVEVGKWGRRDKQSMHRRFAAYLET